MCALCLDSVMVLFLFIIYWNRWRDAAAVIVAVVVIGKSIMMSHLDQGGQGATSQFHVLPVQVHFVPGYPSGPDPGPDGQT